MLLMHGSSGLRAGESFVPSGTEAGATTNQVANAKRYSPAKEKLCGLCVNFVYFVFKPHL